MSACTPKAQTQRFFFLERRLTNTSRCHRLADGQLSSLNLPSSSFSSFGAASVSCAVSLLPCQTRYYRCSSISRVSSSSHSSCTLYSSASFEGPILCSFLRPASRPTSFPSLFVLSASLAPSFPASRPPPCLASFLLPFLPPVHPPSPLLVELQNKQVVYYLI